MKLTLRKINFLFSLLAVTVLFSNCSEDHYCNTAPTFTNQSFEIDENSPSGTIIGKLEYSDAENHDVTFEIVNDLTDGGFQIDQLSKSIVLVNPATIDFEISEKIELAISVKEEANPFLSTTANITININDVDERPVTNLFAYYTFDGHSNDETNNQYHATNYMINYGQGRVNKNGESAQLNGISSYLKLPTDFDKQEKSFSIWFKANKIPVWDYNYSPTTSWSSIISCDHSSLTNSSTRLSVSKIDGINKVWVYVGGMDNKMNPHLIQTEISEGEWHHAVLTISQQYVNFYLNGNLVNKLKKTNNHSVDGHKAVVLGAGRNCWDRFLNGNLDDLRIYDRILTHEEVKLIFKE
ncbi:LamG-like jellyroll fold domain-containing protein [Carboxylicivirga sp. N1Y90]|uniref:LamG-like jellyroll fold domain-containing protein n=1 Tax=Carboxylicivirga fragile TaxID=3417571 RepID=UPI003D3293CF|nr:cadherin domain-containing protein [Marinilabiliaceae bacterium N1Y90]